MKHAGFFMTELLVYLVLSALVGVFVMRYIIGTTFKLRAVTQQTDRIACVHAALDALCADLMQAPLAAAQWQTLTNEVVSWHLPECRTSWFVEKKKLKRKKQTYDRKKQSWKRPVTHVLLEEVEKVRFVPASEQQEVTAISCTLVATVRSGKTYHCARTVALQRKVVVV